MRIYSREDEERIRLQAHVREWRRAGLLEPAQADAFDAELRTDLRRTNTMLRLVLAFFTAIIAAASVAFVMEVFGIREASGTAFVTGLAAVVALIAAEQLVTKARLYRFGVEESLTMAAVAAAGIAAAALWPGRWAAAADTKAVVWLTVAATGSFFVYRRYGYVYAGVTAIGCAALVPFQFRWTPSAVRVTSGALCAIAFAIARRQRLRAGDQFPGDEYATLATAGWLGAYAVLNLAAWNALGVWWFAVPDRDWFYGATYVIVWLMPVAGLWMAVLDKDRTFIAANIGLALATLVTNKAYLGWPRYSWDPTILGTMLIAIALATRRWIASGPNGQRLGYTAERILERERDAVSVLGTVSAALHPQGTAPTSADRPSPGFGGGRSGGAGSSGSF